MEFEQSSLYRETMGVINDTSMQPSYTWAAEVHLPDGTTYPFLKVLSIDNLEDYENEYTTLIFLTGVIAGGVYAKRIYPNQNNLEITLYRIPTSASGESISSSSPLIAERFTVAVDPSKGNPVIESNGQNTVTEEVLNLTEFATVTFQLMDKAVEQMRGINVGGIYRHTTGEKVIRTMLTNASLSTNVEDAQKPVGVTMVPSPNQTEREHIVIPHGIDLVGLPNYIQEKCGGVYGAGLGYFYKTKQWYIYPCYEPERDPGSEPILTIINVPRNKFQFIERTYRNDNGNLVVLATGDTKVKDLSTAFQLNQGNGVRFSNANNFIENFGTITDNKLYVSRASNTTEVVSENRANNTNVVRMNKNPITANPFSAYSQLARGMGSILSLEWQNAELSLIFPGMRVTFMYLDKDNIKTLKGVILKAHHYTKLRGQGITQNQYQTLSSLYVFITRPRE